MAEVPSIYDLQNGDFDLKAKGVLASYTYRIINEDEREDEMEVKIYENNQEIFRATKAAAQQHLEKQIEIGMVHPEDIKIV